MSIDLDHIRSRNPIEDVVAEKFNLKKSGSRFIGVEHDSLVVVPQSGMYFWNSRGEHGDVFDFAGRYLLPYGSGWNNRDATQFMDAVQHLARRAGINIERGTDFRQTAAWAEHQLIQRLNDTLLNTPLALSYATKERGWNMQTIRLAKLGFMPSDKRPFLGGLNLPHTWRSVIHKFPAGMLVYIHLQKGRLTYLSGRSIEGKKHYNPPRDIAGEKQPYFNHCYSEDSSQVVIVEGQADAITFGEWGVPAVAIAGMSVSDELLTRLKRHERVFIALDNTDDANAQSRTIAQALGGRAYLPQFPASVKDANIWLVRDGATSDDAADLLNKAQNWLLAEVNRAANLQGLAREDAICNLFQYGGDLDTFTMAQFKEAMNRIGVKARVFNEMMKASAPNSNTDEGDEMSEVFDDSIPVLSPAQGFRDDLALVTVSLLERTKKNRLNIQPYLVTSSRELKRVTDEQIVSVGGKEIALRVIPEGSEFLQRWRYSDIRRFLDGETVQSGEVFTTIHNLFKQYIDFRSEIESRILALWVAGTYFYQMFPAYPYLALNGPKNSGKSTVLRVLQPLAFNMISTSDPTGASMFRLIHYTSCTVGIDEAERYHNPRDPGMQQIRQLLNSGYKQGMPAIRITGEDMKPQAFDVYSPKILAAIMGLEDILASRCIAIPMRRTDKRIPAFPPDFDGAGIRHQLYTLALTHFKAIQRNYFQRPELHKLHNRSGELWSPLVAYPNLPDLGEYIDNYTGTSADRKHYQRMLTDARKGAFSHVFASVPDRFGRDDVEALRAIDELTQLGICVRFAGHPDLDPADMDDRLYLNILFGMAKREAAVIAKRSTNGMLSKLLKGGWPWAAPDGYLNKETKLSELENLSVDDRLGHGKYKRWVEIDPNQAKVWRYAWDLLLTDRYTLAEICEKLYERGYRLKNGKPFVTVKANGERDPYVQQLSRVFHNWHYAGWVVIENDWANIPPKTVRAEWVPVVSTEEFEQGLAILARRSHTPTPTKRYFYLLQGMVYLQQADGKVRKLTCGTPNANRARGGVSYYCVPSSNQNYLSWKVDAQIPEHLQAIQVDPHLIPEIRKVYLADMGRYTSDRHRETQALQIAIKKLEDKEINLWRAFTEHGMRPQIYEQLAREYEDERQRITAAIDLISKESGEVIDNLDAALAVISEIADRYAEHTPQRQRDILKQMVKRVVIDPEGRIIRMELKPPFNYLDTLAKGGQNGKRGKGSSAGTIRTSTQAGSLHITRSDPNRKELEHLSSLNPLLIEFLQCIAFPQNAQFALLETS